MFAVRTLVRGEESVRRPVMSTSAPRQGVGGAKSWGAEGVPATCPNGGATADSHGLSRSASRQTRRSAKDATVPPTSQADSS